MPSTRITTGAWARGKEAKVIEGVQAALLSSLKIPDYDRDVVIDVHEPSTRIVPTGRSDRYVRLEIMLFCGRSLATKKALYRALVANLSDLGVPENEIKIILIEVPAENWDCAVACPRPRSTSDSRSTSDFPRFMPTPFMIEDLHGHSARAALLDVNNASARQTSLLSVERFDRLIAAAHVALYVPPAVALLLAFEQSDDYDGSHFLWFRGRFDRFLYIDRVIVAQGHRRHGLGRRLYAEVFRRAAALNQSRVVCEVNLDPPNPVSDEFHSAMGFSEVGRATIADGAKTVRYLAADL